MLCQGKTSLAAHFTRRLWEARELQRYHSQDTRLLKPRSDGTAAPQSEDGKASSVVAEEADISFDVSAEDSMCQSGRPKPNGQTRSTLAFLGGGGARSAWAHNVLSPPLNLGLFCMLVALFGGLGARIGWPDPCHTCRGDSVEQAVIHELVASASLVRQVFPRAPPARPARPKCILHKRR